MYKAFEIKSKKIGTMFNLFGHPKMISLTGIQKTANGSTYSANFCMDIKAAIQLGTALIALAKERLEKENNNGK